MKRQMRNKKGISLIVLVITIIVLLILAGAIILTLNNSGIISKAGEAVEKTNTAQVQELAMVLWAEAYLDGEQDVEQAIKDGLQKEKIDITDYIITVTTSGVTVVRIPDKWKANITTIVDTVPIPKGFVASSATGEKTKKEGLVIYEGTDPVTDDNVETARKTRNQYVWVPVDDFSKFVRQSFGQSSVNIVDSFSTSYLNVCDVELDKNNMPLSKEHTSDYMEDGTLTYVTEKTIKEAQAMYASVKEYKGFYVARYEASTDQSRTTATSMMNKIPYQEYSIGEEAVQLARNTYPTTNTNYGVVSTLIYGVQWDAILNWWLEVGASDGNGNVVTSVANSDNYGNYSKTDIGLEDLNSGAQYAVADNDAHNGGCNSYTAVITTLAAQGNQKWVLSTGALKIARVNNIYDMAGNLGEGTMEMNGRNRVGRNMHFYVSNTAIFDRHIQGAPYTMDYVYGFRSALYIKQ